MKLSIPPHMYKLLRGVTVSCVVAWRRHSNKQRMAVQYIAFSDSLGINKQ